MTNISTPSHLVRPWDVRSLRGDAESVFRAGIDGVLGDHLVRQSVTWDGSELQIGDEWIDGQSIDRILVVGAGKASAAMAVGLVQSLSRTPWPIAGLLNVPQGSAGAADRLLKENCSIELVEARPTGANEPTELAVQGTRRMLDLISQMGPRDLCLVLISGGGSALLCQPAGKVTLADKIQVIRHLTSVGAEIGQINTVRKHLSMIKAGGLARAVQAGRMRALVLSDVLGDRLDVIASGPTVPDRSTPSDAMKVLSIYDKRRRLPARIYQHLESAEANPEVQDFPHQRVRTMVVGNNAVAVDSAGIRAESLGYHHMMYCATSPERSANSLGRELAEFAVGLLRHEEGTDVQHDAFISGGEPVVHLVDEEIRGRGGRNQQLVLSAYARLLEMNLSDREWSRIVLLSAGTDGEDGPTDAAGAVIDQDVHRRAIENFLTPLPFLLRNDAYEFFRLTGGLVQTGLTGTNVCDLRVVLVNPLPRGGH